MDNVQCVHCHTLLTSRHVNLPVWMYYKELAQYRQNWNTKSKMMEMRKKARIHIIEIFG